MWLVTKADELTDGVVEVATTGVETPYQTLLVAASSVDQTIFVPVEVVPVAFIPEIAGEVVSGAAAVANDSWPDLLVLPKESLEPTT